MGECNSKAPLLNLMTVIRTGSRRPARGMSVSAIQMLSLTDFISHGQQPTCLVELSPRNAPCSYPSDQGVIMSYKSTLTLLWLIATTACLSALAGCTTLNVGSDYDRAASFAPLHTFTIMQREHKDVQNPLVATRAEDAIREELVRKGYQQPNDRSAADFSVDFTIGSKE